MTCGAFPSLKEAYNLSMGYTQQHPGKNLMFNKRLIGWPVAVFNHARTITMASATGDTRQNDHDKGLCSLRSFINNPVRMDSLDASFPLKGHVVFDFVTKWQILFDILQSA